MIDKKDKILYRWSSQWLSPCISDPSDRAD